MEQLKSVQAENSSDKMIKSIGSFVKKRVANVSNPSLPPPRPPPPRPPLPKEVQVMQMESNLISKEFEVIQEPSFDTESELTDVLNMSGEAVDEQHLDKILDFIDDDVYDTAEEFPKVSSAEGTSKAASPEKESNEKLKSESNNPSSHISSEITEDINTNKREESTKHTLEMISTQKEVVVVDSHETTSSDLKEFIIELEEADKFVIPSETTKSLEEAVTLGKDEESSISRQMETIDVGKDKCDIEQTDSFAEIVLDTSSKELNSINKKESLYESKESLMAELDSAWGSVETKAIEELQPSGMKATKAIFFTSDKGTGKNVKVTEKMGLPQQTTGAQQTVYVAHVSQVSKVYASGNSTPEVPQQAPVQETVSGNDGDVSEDPDYAENTDLAEDGDYTEDETEDEQLFTRESDFWEIDFDKYMGKSQAISRIDVLKLSSFCFICDNKGYFFILTMLTNIAC